MHKILVYGTLRKGCGNHRLLERGEASFLKNTSCLGKLYHLGGFPGIVLQDDNKASVVCEAYEVSDDLLWVLDRLEGHPGFYKRTPVKDTAGDAYQIYALTPQQVMGCKQIYTGDWKNHGQ